MRHENGDGLLPAYLQIGVSWPLHGDWPAETRQNRYASFTKEGAEDPEDFLERQGAAMERTDESGWSECNVPTGASLPFLQEIRVQQACPAQM